MRQRGFAAAARTAFCAVATAVQPSPRRRATPRSVRTAAAAAQTVARAASRAASNAIQFSLKRRVVALRQVRAVSNAAQSSDESTASLAGSCLPVCTAANQFQRESANEKRSKNVAVALLIACDPVAAGKQTTAARGEPLAAKAALVDLVDRDLGNILVGTTADQERVAETTETFDSPFKDNVDRTGSTLATLLSSSSSPSSSSSSPSKSITESVKESPVKESLPVEQWVLKMDKYINKHGDAVGRERGELMKRFHFQFAPPENNKECWKLFVVKSVTCRRVLGQKIATMEKKPWTKSMAAQAIL